MRALLLLWMCVTPAFATTYVPRSIPDYFKDAEIVARILVTKAELVTVEYQGEAVGCGEMVVANVLESFKGDSKVVRFMISGVLLSVGEQYLVFIERATARSPTQITSTNSIAQQHDALLQEACQPNKETFEADWLSTSGFVWRWSEEKQHYEPWILPAYNIAIPLEAGITFREVSLRALAVDGEVINNEFWSVDQGIPMPDIFWMYGGAYEWESYRTYFLEVTRGMEDNKPVNSTR